MYHTWSRIDVAYTSNEIVDFLKELETGLPETADKVFFRTDSSFFQESFLIYWNHFVKIKLKSPGKLLEFKTWEQVNGKKDIIICGFTNKAHEWS